MKSPWKDWPSMEAYVKGLPMRTASGGLSTPNSTSTANNLTVLAHWFDVIQPKRTLEIGLAYGASATLFCELHRQQNQGGHHHAIDPFQNRSSWQGVALEHLKETSLQSWFTFHEDLSSLVLPRLCAEKQAFDMVYVDGSHLFEDVFVDFYYAHQLLSEGGLLAFDDSSDLHVRKVIRFIRANFASFYEEYSPYAVTRPEYAACFGLVARCLNRQQLTLFRKRSSGARKSNSAFRNF